MTVDAKPTHRDGQLFLDGRWRPGAAARTLPSVEKATGRQPPGQALGAAAGVAAEADRYVEALAAPTRAIAVGGPAADQVGLGPMISEEQRDRALRLVEESVRAGATVVEGGAHDGLFVRSTVLSGVTADMPVCTEKVFGPVAPAVVVDSEAQTLELTDATRSGLVDGAASNVEECGEQRWATVQRTPVAHAN